MDELIKLVEEGYTVSLLTDNDGDYTIAVAKNESEDECITTNYILKKEDYDNASNKTELIDEYFEKAEKDLDKQLAGDLLEL